LIDLVLYLDEEAERMYTNIKRQGTILEAKQKCLCCKVNLLIYILPPQHCAT
jgi:hypothetical protein